MSQRDVCPRCGSWADWDTDHCVACTYVGAPYCLVRKYRRLLDSPDWSAIQLSRMGHTMREYILADLALRDRVRMRLRILALRSAVEAPTFKRVG